MKGRRVFRYSLSRSSLIRLFSVASFLSHGTSRVFVENWLIVVDRSFNISFNRPSIDPFLLNMMYPLSRTHPITRPEWRPNDPNDFIPLSPSQNREGLTPRMELSTPHPIRLIRSSPQSPKVIHCSVYLVLRSAIE